MMAGVAPAAGAPAQAVQWTQGKEPDDEIVKIWQHAQLTPEWQKKLADGGARNVTQMAFMGSDRCQWPLPACFHSAS